MKTRIFTSLIFCVLSTALFSQAPDWAWAKSSGGVGEDDAHKVATDASGNVYIAGIFNSASITIGSNTLTNTGASDVFVAKYDASGNPLWAVSGSGAGYDGMENIATDANGNVYVVGFYGGAGITFGSEFLANAGGCDAFVVKYDPDGNVVWARRSGGTSYDQVEGVAVDGNGDVAIVGIHQNDTYTIGNISLPSSGDNDVFLAKYDSSGNAIWAKSAAGSGWDDAFGVAVDGANNIYISGYFGSAIMQLGSLTLTNTGSSNIFIAKYDAAGSAIWAKNPGGSTFGYAAGIRTDGLGNVYVSGYFASGSMDFDGHTITNTGGSDMYLVKFDGNGNTKWVRSAGGPDVGSNTSWDLATDASGNIYVTGYFGSPTITFGSTTLTNNGSVDIYVVKYDTDGNVLWALNPDGPVDDIAYGINVDGSGNVLVAGGFLSSAIAFGNSNLNNNGNWDIFVAKLGSTCNIAQPVISASGPLAFCQGDSVTLTSTVAGSYLWSNATTGRSVTLKAAGSYTVVVSNGGGCSATSAPTVIAVHPAANTGLISANPDTICSGSQANLLVSVSTATSLHWQSSATSSNFTDIAGTTDSTYSNSFNQTTYFRVYVSNGACTDTSATVELFVYPAVAIPVLTAADSIICSSDSALINTSAGYASYIWNNGDTTNYTYATGAGGYWLTVTDANGCSATSLHKNIEVYPVPSVSIIVQGDTLTSFGAVAYQWFLNDKPIPESNHPVYVAQQSGNYSVQITDANGCKALSSNTPVLINGVVEAHENILSVYPNPLSIGNWQLTVDNSLIGSNLEMYDGTGRILFKSEIRSSKSEIMSNVSSGVYYLKIITTNRAYIQRLIRQ